MFHYPMEQRKRTRRASGKQSDPKRYVVDPASRQPMRSELAVLGITHSVVFPDIDGLASELKERYSSMPSLGEASKGLD